MQTKVNLSDFGTIDTSWNYYMIPIRKFQNSGLYWDETVRQEILNDVNWTKINEFRFSVNKHENRVSGNEPVSFYVHDIAVIKEIPGMLILMITGMRFVPMHPI